MILHSQDFSDDYGGYCVTTSLDGKEFILSQCFTEGTQGVGAAVRDIVTQMNTIPTVGIRFCESTCGISNSQARVRCP